MVQTDFALWKLTFGNVYTMKDLFTMFDVHALLQFLQKCNIYNKVYKILLAFVKIDTHLFLRVCIFYTICNNVTSDGKLNGAPCQA